MVYYNQRGKPATRPAGISNQRGKPIWGPRTGGQTPSAPSPYQNQRGKPLTGPRTQPQQQPYAAPVQQQAPQPYAQPGNMGRGQPLWGNTAQPLAAPGQQPNTYWDQNMPQQQVPGQAPESQRINSRVYASQQNGQWVADPSKMGTVGGKPLTQQQAQYRLDMIMGRYGGRSALGGGQQAGNLGQNQPIQTLEEQQQFEEQVQANAKATMHDPAQQMIASMPWMNQNQLGEGRGLSSLERLGERHKRTAQQRNQLAIKTTLNTKFPEQAFKDYNLTAQIGADTAETGRLQQDLARGYGLAGGSRRLSNQNRRNLLRQASNSDLSFRTSAAAGFRRI